MTTDSRPVALIYRKRLLSWSETFIAAQANALERYQPVYAGLRHKSEGRSYMGSAASVALEDHAFSYPVAKALLFGPGVVPPRWRRALAGHQPAVVHAHFGWEAPAGAALARAFRIALVVTFHGMDITLHRRRLLERRQHRSAFRDAGRIIAVSEFIAGKLRDAGAPAERLVVHHIGVDTARFAPADSPRARHEVLFVGRLVEKKGLIHLLRAMVRVQEALPGATVTIAGDGELRASLQREAERLRVNATWLGVQPPEAVRALMRRASVLAAPSIVAEDGNAEGLPMSIAEAQASGLPAVVFPSGGSAEGVVEGETGYVLPPGDETGLADRLLALLTDDERHARFSRAAREWALREFDLAKQTRRLEEIYDAVRAEYVEHR